MTTVQTENEREYTDLVPLKIMVRADLPPVAEDRSNHGLKWGKGDGNTFTQFYIKKKLMSLTAGRDRSRPSGCMHQLACTCGIWGSDKWPTVFSCLIQSHLGKQQGRAGNARKS